MAGAAVVGATVVGATMVGAAAVGAAEVGVTSGVLYGAAVVQQWLALAQQCVRSNRWSNNRGYYLCAQWCVEPCVAQCQYQYAGRRVVLSRDTQSDACGIKRNGVRR